VLSEIPTHVATAPHTRRHDNTRARWPRIVGAWRRLSRPRDQVGCTAVDDAGNGTQATFMVYVRSG